MAKRLTDLTREEDRKRVLDSTSRLADFNYSLDLDGPTPKQTEEAQRIAEEDEFDSMCSELLRREKIKKYVSFLKDVENLRISFKKSEDADSKRELLNNYFPNKYKSQRLSEYSDTKFNEVFLGFVDYARAVVRKSKNK